MPDTVPVLPAFPTPCTPGQIFTLKFLCNGDGNGGTLYWSVDATGIAAPSLDILAKAIDKDWKPSDVHKLAESLRPAPATPCGGGKS